MGSKAPHDKSQAVPATALPRSVIERALRDALDMVWPILANLETLHVEARHLRPKARADAMCVRLNLVRERVLFDQSALIDAVSVALERAMAIEASCLEKRP